MCLNWHFFFHIWCLPQVLHLLNITGLVNSNVKMSFRPLFKPNWRPKLWCPYKWQPKLWCPYYWHQILSCSFRRILIIVYRFGNWNQPPILVCRWKYSIRWLHIYMKNIYYITWFSELVWYFNRHFSSIKYQYGHVAAIFVNQYLDFNTECVHFCCQN